MRSAGMEPPLLVALYDPGDVSLWHELRTHLDGLGAPVRIWDERCIDAGVDRARALLDHVDRARLLILLLSAGLQSRGGPILRRAAERAQRREATLVIVPARAVGLDGSPLKGLQMLPRGGGPLAIPGVDPTGRPLAPPGVDRDAAWAEVAGEIDRLLQALERRRPRLNVYRGNLGAAVRLDRIRQWDALVTLCRGPDHAFILAHGPRQQNISQFRQRALIYLGEEHAQTHHLLVLPVRHQGRNAPTAADWEERLRGELLAQLGAPSGSTCALLRQIAAELPLFLFIGENPVEQLPPAHEAALGEFLGARLPRLIAEARPDNPVRAFLAVDYRDAAASLVPRVHAWGARAQAGGMVYTALDPIAPPPWHEVETYMREHDPRPSEDDILAMKSKYEELCAPGREVSFLELAEELDRFLLNA